MRRSKYGVRHDPAGIAARSHAGIRFDSKMEKDRYVELLLLERADHIMNLRRQVPFGLWAYNMTTQKPEHVGTYVVDFVYHDKPSLRIVHEDVKGFRTPVYAWKKRMMKACYGVEISEWPPRLKKAPHGKR